MAHPHGFPDFRKEAREIQDVLVGAAGQRPVARRVCLLEVEQDEVRVFEHGADFRESRLFAGKRRAGGVEARVDARGLRLFEEFGEKFRLPERFPAADRDAAFGSPVRTETQRLLQQFIGRKPQRRVLHAPGVGVVAVLAAHRASLQKDDVPHARPVDGAEAFERMDKRLWHKFLLCRCGSDARVARAGDYVELLLAGQVDEFHGVAGDADREVRVLLLFRMLHRVDELFAAEDVDI